MKPIFLATCYFQPDYGSVLQAYATQEFLDINNVLNLTIDISGISGTIKQCKMAYFKRNLLNKDVVFDELATVKLVLQKRLNRTLGANVSKRTRLFNTFSGLRQSSMKFLSEALNVEVH